MRTDPPTSLDGISRIAIFGVTGSGKSTLGRRLGELADVPFHEMDRLYWLPGWVKRDEVERSAIASALRAEPGWVVDSLWSVDRAQWLSRADLLVALDYSRALTLRRLVVRTIRRIVTREEICNGNVESLRGTLSHDSILVWHVRTYADRRRQIAAFAAAPGPPAVVVFSHPRETEAWLRQLA